MSRPICFHVGSVLQLNKWCELLYLVAGVENSILWVDCFLWFIEMAEKEKQLVSEVSSSEEKKLDFAGIALTTSTPKTTKEGDRVKQKLPHTIADDLQSVKPKVSAPDQDAVLHLGQKHKNPFSKLACNFGDTSSSGTKNYRIPSMTKMVIVSTKCMNLMQTSQEFHNSRVMTLLRRGMSHTKSGGLRYSA